ncbi:hypothetical protein JCM11251_006997 [Rhodosporidiobolus azoricus]
MADKFRSSLLGGQTTTLAKNRKGEEAPVTSGNEPRLQSDTPHGVEAATGGNIDLKRMHQEADREAHDKLAKDTVHDFVGQEPAEAVRAEKIRKSPSMTDEAKLNALDDAEALPHHGFLPGDL